MESEAQKRDYQKGLRVVGSWENDRNAASRPLFTEMLKEALGIDQTIIAHHLVYVKMVDDYTIVEEIPSADALIFNHEIMRKLFGDGFLSVLQTLACEPCETRDAKLAEFYNARKVTQ